MKGEREGLLRVYEREFIDGGGYGLSKYLGRKRGRKVLSGRSKKKKKIFGGFKKIRHELSTGEKRAGG